MAPSCHAAGASLNRAALALPLGLAAADADGQGVGRLLVAAGRAAHQVDAHRVLAVPDQGAAPGVAGRGTVEDRLRGPRRQDVEVQAAVAALERDVHLL